MFRRKINIIVLASAISSTSFGAAQFVQKGTCGSAKITGDSCSNVEIEFAFDSCELKSAAKKVSDITCSDKKISARYTKKNQRYEVSFEKGKEGWKPEGALTQYIQEKAKVEKEASSEKSGAAIVAPSAAVSVTASGSSDKKVVEEKANEKVAEAKKTAGDEKEKSKIAAADGKEKPVEASAADKKEKPKKVAKKAKEEAPKLTEEQKLAEAIKIVEAAKAAEEAKKAEAAKLAAKKAEEAKRNEETKLAIKKAEEAKKIEDAKLAAKQAEDAAKAAEAAKAAAAAPPAASGLKWSGFFDARLSNYTIKDSNSTATGNPESGFLIEDGAVYLNYEKDNLSFVVDMPFRRLKVGDSNPAAANANVSNNGNVTVGADKTQVFAKMKLNDFFAVTLGQFDTIFGVELNDSKDRTFGKTGLLYDQMLPVIHDGVMIDYAKGSFYAKIFSANSNNKGSLGDGATLDNSYEYGGALGIANENFHAQVGAMSRSILKASGGNELASRTLGDFIFGGVYKDFAIDVELALLADPSKNTLSPGDTSDSESSGQALMVLPTYKVNDKTTLGLRYENVRNDPSAASYMTVNSYGASYHYKYSSQFEFRAEYIGYSYKKVDETTFNTSRSSIGTVVTF